MILLTQYAMGRDKQYPKEWTPEIISNASVLLGKVNSLLADLKWASPIVVESGWRPASINASTPGAKPKSNHLTGMAIDLKDDSLQTLAKLAASRVDLLIKHGLYMEAPQSTKGKYTNWLHFQTKKTVSGRRIFLP